MKKFRILSNYFIVFNRFLINSYLPCFINYGTITQLALKYDNFTIFKFFVFLKNTWVYYHSILFFSMFLPCFKELLLSWHQIMTTLQHWRFARSRWLYHPRPANGFLTVRFIIYSFKDLSPNLWIELYFPQIIYII